MIRLTRARRAALFMLLAAFGSIAASGQQPGSQTTGQGVAGARRDAHVIMISIDGLVPEYYTDAGRLGLRVPNMIRMKLDGAYADGVEGVYPSVTYPAHTTLVTGVRPAAHGIIQNRIFEAPTDAQTREWYWFSEALKSDTLWTIAKKAGFVTAGVGWPVTVGSNLDYNVPEIVDPKEDPPTPRRTLQHATPGLIQAALSEMSVQGDNSTDGRRVAISEFIINRYKPNLLLIHLIALDDAHHRHGPRSAEGLKTAERMDGYIGRIIEATRKAGIFEKTTFILTSDHGFAEVSKKFEPNVLLVKEGLITLDSSGKPTAWKAAAWPAGGSCAIMLKDAADKETAKKVDELFARLALRSGSPVNRVLKEGDLKRLGAIPGAYLMLDAAPGFAFDEKLSGPEIHEAKNYLGTHGHLPSRAELRSSLIIYGATARTGARVGIARMIDIAPTAAAVLGLAFEKAEGAPLEEFLKPGVIPPQVKKPKKARQ